MPILTIQRCEDCGREFEDDDLYSWWAPREDARLLCPDCLVAAEMEL
jgi:DNA-directed RNA polymerase subunit RPC12/RpoP